MIVNAIIVNIEYRSIVKPGQFTECHEADRARGRLTFARRAAKSRGAKDVSLYIRAIKITVDREIENLSHAHRLLSSIVL